MIYSHNSQNLGSYPVLTQIYFPYSFYSTQKVVVEKYNPDDN